MFLNVIKVEGPGEMFLYKTFSLQGLPTEPRVNIIKVCKEEIVQGGELLIYWGLCLSVFQFVYINLYTCMHTMYGSRDFQATETCTQI